MKSLTVARIQEVSAGRLCGLRFEDSVWYFEFEEALVVESYSSWRLFDSSGGKKVLVGSRDLLGAKKPYRDISKLLEGFKLGALHFHALRDSLELAMFTDGFEEQRNIEIFRTSVSSVNWRIVGEDFVDSDQIGLIENLDAES